MSSGLFPGLPQIVSTGTKEYFIAQFSRFPITLHNIFTRIWLSLYIPQSSIITVSSWNLWSARWVITIHRRFKKYTLRDYLHSRKYIMVTVHQMFELPTLSMGIVSWIANVHNICRMKQDDEHTDQKISNGKGAAPRESTSFSNFEEDNLDHQQVVLHEGQLCWDARFRTTMVSLHYKESCADIVVTCHLPPSLGQAARAIEPPLLLSQQSTSRYYFCLTWYQPMHSPMLVETRMHLNHSPLEFETFLNTNGPLLR